MTAAEATVMRGIVDREHRKALAERRDARAKHAEATKPVPSTVSWSTKAPPKRKTSPTDKLIADTVADRRLRWSQRHKETAAAERSLRKSRAEMLGRWDHKANGTAETHEHAAEVRTREGSLARLYMSGAIDAEQLAAAVEIATVAEQIRSDVDVRTASLETRVDVTRLGDGTFYEKLGRVRREMAYTRWRAEVRGPVAAVLEMIVGDAVGYTVAAGRHRMSNRRAKQLLLDALDLWPRILGKVAKEVDAATLAAAHAGILA